MAEEKKKYVEKKLYTCKVNTNDNSKKRDFRISKRNHSLVIAVRRWSEEYSSFLLKANTSLSTSYDKGIGYLTYMFEQAAEFAKDYKADESMVGKKVYKSFYTPIVDDSSIQGTFTITLVQDDKGELKIVYSLSVGDNKDIVQLDDSSVEVSIENELGEEIPTVGAYITLSRVAKKLSSFDVDFEANDKHFARMMADDSSSKDGNDKQTPANEPDTDPF